MIACHQQTLAHYIFPFISSTNIIVSLTVSSQLNNFFSSSHFMCIHRPINPAPTDLGLRMVCEMLLHCTYIPRAMIDYSINTDAIR